MPFQAGYSVLLYRMVVVVNIAQKKNRIGFDTFKNHANVHVHRAFEDP